MLLIFAVSTYTETKWRKKYIAIYHTCDNVNLR